MYVCIWSIWHLSTTFALSRMFYSFSSSLYIYLSVIVQNQKALWFNCSDIIWDCWATTGICMIIFFFPGLLIICLVVIGSELATLPKVREKKYPNVGQPCSIRQASGATRCSPFSCFLATWKRGSYTLKWDQFCTFDRGLLL